MIAHILKSAGFLTGVTTTEEVMVDGKIIERGDCAGAGSARQVLAVPTLEAAVLETARGGIIKYGLGFDRCIVAVVTNVDADHLGQYGVDTLEDLARVKLTVPLYADSAVLNADNSYCLAMRRSLEGKNIVLFSASADNSAIQEHVVSGGTAYVLSTTGNEDSIVRLEAERSTVLLPVTDLPITFNGSARYNIENAMAAMAAVHCLGIDDRTVYAGARSFHSDHISNPGRLNHIQGFDFDLIFDYAHNKHGFAAVAGFVSRRNRTGRNICVVAMDGNRITDEVACDAMTALAGHFDHYVTCNDDPPKYRRSGFPGILGKGLVAAGVGENMITVLENVDEAIETALAMARPGDLVMVLGGIEPGNLISRRDRDLRHAQSKCRWAILRMCRRICRRYWTACRRSRSSSSRNTISGVPSLDVMDY